VHGYRSYIAAATLGRQGVEPALNALAQESARARQYGFQGDELERAKKNLLRSLEQAQAERDKTDSASYAAEYLRNFLEQETIPGIDNELQYVRTLLPTIALADVNGFAQTVIPEQAAKLVIYTGSSQADSPAPDQGTLMNRLAQAERQSVRAPQAQAAAGPLMAQPPAGGRIVAERPNPALGLTELELSNGVHVILKPTDFKNDEIVMAANRFGGQSRYGQVDMFNASYAGQVTASMGLGDFSPIALQKVLAGKVVSVNTGLQLWTDTVMARAGNDDLETLLQLLTLKFGPARQDADLYQSFVSRSQDAARHTMARPEARFADAVQRTLFNGHPRVHVLPAPEDFDQMS